MADFSGLFQKSNIVKPKEFWYYYGVMENRVHFYVSRKNMLTWLMALCLVCSAVARMVIPGLKYTL